MVRQFESAKDMNVDDDLQSVSVWDLRVKHQVIGTVAIPVAVLTLSSCRTCKS